MKKQLKWLFMLNKRLYKKVSFVLLMILIPVCVGLFSIYAQQNSGFLHIALAQSSPEDPEAGQVIEDLVGADSVIRYTVAETPDQAIAMVETGKADEAWIITQDMQKQVHNFVAGKSTIVATVITREQSVALRLAREKLSSTLFKVCAKTHFVDYTRNNIPKLDGLTDAEILSYFESAAVDETLFQYDDSTGSATVETNYLTTPIRGFLGILMVLCGMAAAMYYMQDERHGTFAWAAQEYREYILFASVLIATINVVLVMLASLTAASLVANIFKELLILLLHAVCCAAFCFALKQIFNSIYGYAALIPLVTVAMIAVCPVFFDFKKMPYIRNLFPPTYYVNAQYNNVWIFYMVLYSCACVGIGVAVKHIKAWIKKPK